MEIAVDAAIPTYSGGLGVLARDTVRTAADLGIPFVAITQLSRDGYFRQVIGPDGEQREEPVRWSPSDRPGPDDDIGPDERLTREIEDLYGKLEYVILPKYYQDPDAWTRMMRESIDDLASYFNTHRMLRQYVTEAYFCTDY